MRSSFKGRCFLLLVSVSAALGLACSKRSGLDRGDANEAILRKTAPNAAESASNNQPHDDETGPAESPRFAAAPEGDVDGATEALPEPARSRPAETEVASKSKSSGEASAPAMRSSQPAASAAPPAAEMSARGDSAYTPKSRQRESFQPREERPGLGTSWGETRKSWVSTVSFERESPTAPTATQRIFYNDASGILAQTGARSVGVLGQNQTDLGRGFVTVEIVAPDGLPLPGLVSGGRSFVVGRDGDHYAIRIRNHERYRVEVVATVDGLDVIDGTTGNYQKRGYVIEPYATLLIEGFRKSTNAVASFRFGTVSGSYAARTGSDRHVGVIGVALFAERGCCNEDYSNQELYRRETADPFPGQFARPPRQPQPRRQYWAE